MGRGIRYIFVLGIIFYHHVALAQQGFYVPNQGKIFFNGDSATIFSDVINQGNFGLGKNAFVNFSGTIWNNSPLSFISDESNAGTGVTGTGGWVRFLSDSLRQQLIGGYNAASKSGPQFPHLQIQNINGVDLSQSSTKVRKEINFSTGKIYLNDVIMVVGDNNPGKISGYDSLRYFVTANKPGTGLLVRENIKSTDGRVDFPIGDRDNSYTPAAVKSSSSIGDDYYVNVFDSVKSGRLTGSSLVAQSVNKTWEIGKRFRPGLDEAEIFLQHLNSDEGSYFTANKNNAYVSYYNGSNWDTGSPQSYPSPGYITTGNPLDGSGLNSRVFSNTVSAPSYFTKLTGVGDTSSSITTLWLYGWRLDPNIVNLYWRAPTWTNIQYYVLQRRLSNELVFKNIDTVLAPNYRTISANEFFYLVSDSNNYTGISYYRLQRLDSASIIDYSNIVAIGGNPGSYINMIWPNPSTGTFNISLNQTIPFKAILIHDVLGQLIKVEAVNGRNLIQMTLTTSGTYFVSLVNAAGIIVDTKKIVIAH